MKAIARSSRALRGRFCARQLCTSAPRWGQEPEDMIMGDRAAQRTNTMLDKIGSMYKGQNFGYSKKYSDNYERVFGKKKTAGHSTPEVEYRDVEFGPGSLGMEITWSIPPVVTAAVPGGAAEKAGVENGSVILRINKRDTTTAIPELELDDLMQRRPLVMRLASKQDAAAVVTDMPDAAVGVSRMGVAKVPGVLPTQSCAALVAFALEERQRCFVDIAKDPSLATAVFSDVQTARAADGALQTRWDMRLPVMPVVYDALRSVLGRSPLGSAIAALAGGPEAELWELGLVVSEPGAAPQPVHLDAPEMCLFSTFVALQDVTFEMGPTLFMPGTNTSVAHSRFAAEPQSFLEQTPRAVALLGAGDAVLYDSRILHAGGENRSDKTRMLMYITFRHAEIDPKELGIDQHSIRPELAGRYRLRDFLD